MVVDELTYFVLTVLLTVVSAAVLTLIRIFHGQRPCLDCWIVASYAQIVALLILLLQATPSNSSLFLMNSLFWASFILIVVGHHNYLQLKLNRRFISLVIVSYLILNLYSTLFINDTVQRVSIFSAAIALCCFYCAVLYFRYFLNNHKPALWLVIGLYLFLGICLLLRIYFARQQQDESQQLLLGAPALLSLALFTANALQSYVFYFLMHWRQIIQLEQLANYDVTGAMRRNYFIKLLDKMTRRAQFRGAEVALIFIDLDRFKLINDNYGHHSGDLALQHFAQIVMNNLRVGDIFGRFGGEEFVIALNNSNTQQAYALANRIRIQLHQQALVTNKGKVYLSASFGLASYQHEGDCTELIKQADLAMYQAKSQGGNKVIIYTAELNQQ
ncbi:GGDEF domain-containing protein [Agarivorans gilvus]|jgi:diguanylate cyclase (GGDEF)-like protein|uniref:diguanylate cyclase n=1 Tax=Agarivorans gilvus TaxID=680279 RepID=A0ABQ1I2P2_9ALTE|nr:GGDEF domain-containing protein [Agarivorans gilvus]GGB07471.1 hypothetical protein GCM10007414_21020 [Agarivorans gilvus]